MMKELYLKMQHNDSLSFYSTNIEIYIMNKILWMALHFYPALPCTQDIAAPPEEVVNKY